MEQLAELSRPVLDHVTDEVLCRLADAQESTLLELIQEKNEAQGKTPATRSDLRINLGPDNQVLLLNKGDGTIRLLAP